MPPSTWTIRYGAIAAGFGVFVAARAARVALTYDEAATYIRYLAPHTFPEFDGGPLAVFNFEVATNHLLSTLLARVATLVAGTSELALRVPALVGYGLYVWFAARILRRVTTGAIAAAGLLLLNLNPYLLDFFALGRGYGLSIGLMMGALDALLAGHVQRTLRFAAAAVLANFALLNVYLALAVLLVAARWMHGETAEASVPHRRSLALLFAVAACFTALVFSQDPGLSPSLYEPVTVRVEGLDAVQAQQIRISRVDLRGRVAPLTAARVPIRAVRVEAPAAVAGQIARIELLVGARAFSGNPNRAGLWVARDNGGRRQFESAEAVSAPRSATREFRAVMNWAGDRHYVIAIARATSVALVLLALAAALLTVSGAWIVRARWLPADLYGPVSHGLLWLAALAGPPLYLLHRDAQLYFGGTRGLVPDTFYSLIEGTFYGRVYGAGQVPIVFAIAVLLAAAFAGVAARVRRTPPLTAAAQVLALIALVAIGLVAQRWLFGTVYLIGRTALFLIPLYTLFAILFCAALAACGRVARSAAVVLLGTALGLSAYHFVSVANLHYALDWRDDADTRSMMNDLERVVEEDRPSGPRATLGVEWIYAPVAVYYANRHDPVDIDVTVAPYTRRVDFTYVAERHAGGTPPIKSYPIAGTVLARPH